MDISDHSTLEPKKVDKKRPRSHGHKYNEEQNKPTICRFIGKLGVLERGKTHPQNAASLFTFGMLFYRFRSFNSENIRSIDEKASKLLAVKVGGLKKKSAAQPWPHSNQSARI